MRIVSPLLLLTITVSAFGQAPAAGTPAAAAAGAIDPAAMQIIEASGKAAEAASSLYMEANSDMSTTLNGKPTQTKTTMRLWQKKPKMYLISQGSGNDMTLINDGKQMMMYFPARKQYTLSPAPAAGSEGAVGANLMAGNSMEEMKKVIKSASIVGNETINGQATKHLKVQMGNAPADMWFTDSATPVLVRMSINVNQGGFSMQTTTDMKYVLNQEIPDSTFNIAPPPGATQVSAPAGMGMGAATGAAPRTESAYRR